MSNESAETHYLGIYDGTQLRWELIVANKLNEQKRPPSRWSYRSKRGQETIKLNGVEFRIFQFLSSRPYHAFTPRQIVEAVSTQDQPVSEETLRDHILSLREKLGFFSDYIQTVPYIGYRFKE